jgi:hypothetical protein
MVAAPTPAKAKHTVAAGCLGPIDSETLEITNGNPGPTPNPATAQARRILGASTAKYRPSTPAAARMMDVSKSPGSDTTRRAAGASALAARKNAQNAIFALVAA